jgi:hypothetical protein
MLEPACHVVWPPHAHVSLGDMVLQYCLYICSFMNYIRGKFHVCFLSNSGWACFYVFSSFFFLFLFIIILFLNYFPYKYKKLIINKILWYLNTWSFSLTNIHFPH